GKSPETTQVQAQKPDSSAETECPSPSQGERPPPGKVKLIPLPFSAWDKPQARPAPRRPRSMSKPIEQEQRPEREAMKRRAQQQRENAARYTSSGKL
ncbi:uncharacterized protein C2orf78-like, partial [Megaptera novaeangliae]